MTSNLLSFDQALKKAEPYGKKHLLLGNGFSIACKPDIFAYGSLFEEAKKTMSVELAAIFAAMGTQDFEEVIRALQNAATIVSVYRPKLTVTKRLLLADADKLKAGLIQAVAGRHPARPNDIADDRYHACRKFLANFIGAGVDGKVYTMNYDLLLYWALMHEEEDSATHKVLGSYRAFETPLPRETTSPFTVHLRVAAPVILFLRRKLARVIRLRLAS